MAKKREPRVSNYLGMKSEAIKYPNGTWLEPEEFCYPKGGFTRWAYVIHKELNRFVLVRCSVPDTYFSVPAKLRDYKNKKTVNGFVSGDETGLTFTPCAHKSKEKTDV